MTRALEPTRRARPRLLPGTWFALATAAISALAWLETSLARFPGHDRLFHPMFDRLFAFDDNRGALLWLAIVLLVAMVPALRTGGERLARALGERPGVAAAITCLVLAFCARFVYHAHPLAMDESAPVAQAYAFAAGHLSWSLPPGLLDRMVPAGFRGAFLAVNPASGEVVSLYWPGYAALLAPFAWAGVPWILNPLLTALTLLLLHRLAMRLFDDRETAGWVVLFAIASPVIVAEGISYYSMPAHLAANLLYALLLLEARPLRALAAGLVGGLALTLHNPVPHLLFALPWGLWLLLARARWPALGMLLLGYLPGLAVVALWPMFGNLVAPVAATGAGGSLLEVARAKLGQSLAWPAYQTVVYRLTGTWKLWLWSVPGLMILAAAGLQRLRGPLLLLAASALLTYVGYLFVPVDQGHGWGYRYFHSAWGALPLLAAAWLHARRGDADGGALWRAWAGGFALAALVLGNGLRLAQVDAVISEHLAQRLPVPAQGRWVRFITFKPGLYTWDLVQNVPSRDQTYTLMSFGPDEDRQLMARQFPAATLSIADERGSLWQLR